MSGSAASHVRLSNLLTYLAVCAAAIATMLVDGPSSRFWGGVGIALRSLWDVSQELAAGRLQQILQEWEGPHDLGIYAVHPPTPTPIRTVTAFVEFLEQKFSPVPW